MKTDTQTSENSKPRSTAKIRSSKTLKAATKKSATTTSTSPRKRNSSPLRGAEKGFIARGKNVLGQVPNWASDAAGAVPRSVRNLEFPDAAFVQNFIRDKPLIVGALGLGLGAMAGALLPTFRKDMSPKRKK